MKSVRIGRDGRTYISSKTVTEMVSPAKGGVDSVSNREQLLAVKITVQNHDVSFSSYHTFGGGGEFRPVLPRTRLAPGEVAVVSIEPLPLDAFLAELPGLKFTNVRRVGWASETTLGRVFKRAAGVLELSFTQEHHFVGPKDFTLLGNIERYPGKSNQHRGIYLQFGVRDYAGRTVEMRLRHDGLNPPGLQINRGAGFETVHLVSFDGYRLAIIYGGIWTISTIYLEPPPIDDYGFGPLRRYNGKYLDFMRNACSEAWTTEVQFRRRLGRIKFEQGSVYDQGRLGSEIAYAVGVKHLGLGSLVIEEPSRGGRDLHTKDGKVAIQARLLRDIPIGEFDNTIQTALMKLVNKLWQDYKYNSRMQTGYAILSFKDAIGIVRSVVSKVNKPAEGSAPSTPRLRGACSAG